ncbi:MAG: DUF5615 family PIN-like protein [Bryobacteraceae bacterium]
MKFLVDNQLPAALARFLATRGVDCQHVLDIGLGDASDAEIWEHAGWNDCVVISKDEIFSTWRTRLRPNPAHLDSFRESPYKKASRRRGTSVCGNREL